MNNTEAATLARRLMNQHGLGHVPFEFDRAVRRVGACHFRILKSGKRVVSADLAKITLSHKFVPVLSENEVRDVILHEIAHAIAGFDANHGHKWRQIARSIGCTAERCSDVPPEVRPQPHVAGICPSCRVEKMRRFRRPNRGKIFSCVPCRRQGMPSVLVWVNV